MFTKYYLHATVIHASCDQLHNLWIDCANTAATGSLCEMPKEFSQGEKIMERLGVWNVLPKQKSGRGDSLYRYGPGEEDLHRLRPVTDLLQGVHDRATVTEIPWAALFASQEASATDVGIGFLTEPN